VTGGRNPLGRLDIPSSIPHDQTSREECIGSSEVYGHLLPVTYLFKPNARLIVPQASDNSIFTGGWGLA